MRTELEFDCDDWEALQKCVEVLGWLPGNQAMSFIVKVSIENKEVS